MVKINPLVFYNFLSKYSTKEAINYFFHTHDSGCSNMKVQNAFLTKFMIMKLKTDAWFFFLKCSIRK